MGKKKIVVVLYVAREGVRTRVLLRHVQRSVAEQTPNVRLQTAVDTDEPGCCGPHRGVSHRHQTGLLLFFIHILFTIIQSFILLLI